MKHILTSLVVFLLAHITYGQQTVSISLTDANAQKIPNATIEVLNQGVYTYSDTDGNASLDLEIGKYDISVTCLGYTKSIHEVEVVDGTNAYFITLEPSLTILDEVVVKASKRQTDRIATPLSVSTLDSRAVEDREVRSLAALTAMIPNYNYQQLGVSFQQVQSIRGVQVFSENPAVATYVDGVNNLDILANGFLLTDIESIEVLRGPQGTLFGRNAMGGVVNIKTKTPTNRTRAYVSGGYGNLDLYRLSGGISTPLIANKLFVQLNGQHQSREGYWTNNIRNTNSTDTTLNGVKVGGEQNTYINGTIKYLISDKMDLTLNSKVQRDLSDNTSFFISQLSDSLAFANPDEVNLTRIGSHERLIASSNLTMNAYLDNSKISSTTTYQGISLAFENVDFPGYYHSFRDTEIGERLSPQRVYTQELHINNLQPINGLSYTAGIYGFIQEGYEPSTNLAFELDSTTYSIFRNESKNKGVAAYGEMIYEVNKWSFTGGIRYDYEDRESTFNGFGDAALIDGELIINQPDTTISADYSAISPKLSVGYQITPNQHVYLTYTRGFRAGGVNAQRTNDTENFIYDPEYSDNYEVGYKTRQLDNKLSLAVSAFMIQWRDLQFFNLVAPFTYARENVGDARSSGIELEAQAIVARGFRADLAIGLNSTAYNDVELKRVDVLTGVESIFDVTGNSLSNAPSHTLHIGLQYEKQIANMNWMLIVEGNQVGTYYTDIQNAIEQPTYELLNVKLSMDYKNAVMSLWGQNILNRRYLSFGNPDSSFGRSVRTSSPGTYGMDVSYQF